MPAGPDLDSYGLAPPVEIFPLAQGENNTTLGVRTCKGKYVWKEYTTHRDAGTILYEHRLLTWLETQGLPFDVPAPVPDRDGNTLRRSERGWGALFPLLAGKRPDERNPRHAEAVGAALGELQAALARYPAEPRPGLPGYGELGRLHERIPDPFGLVPEQIGLPETQEHEELFGWWREMLSDVREFVEGTYRRLPWQVIHGDFAPSNTLVLGNKVSAVLDFDMAGPDARALDLASGLTFTMRVLENPDPWEPGRAFCRGYAEWVRLTEAEVAAVPQLILLRDAASAVWWLGRGTEAGNPEPGLKRVADMKEHERWLGQNAGRLVETLAQEMEGDPE